MWPVQFPQDVPGLHQSKVTLPTGPGTSPSYRLSLRGNSTDCQVTLVAGTQDHGTWTCLLTLQVVHLYMFLITLPPQGDYSAQRTWVDLRVTTTPVISLQVY